MALPKLIDVTIDGKKGQLAYFDAAGKMTDDKDKAVQAKVVFEDGDHLWLVPPTQTPPSRLS